MCANPAIPKPEANRLSLHGLRMGLLLVTIALTSAAVTSALAQAGRGCSAFKPCPNGYK